MAKLLPFVGHVLADDGAATDGRPPNPPPTPGQRVAMAAADPRSFLNILPSGAPEAAGDLEHTLQACRRHLDRYLHDGSFRRLDRPTLAVIAFGHGPDRVTAVVGDLEVSAFGRSFDPTTFDDAEVLPHERVRQDRVRHLVRYLEVVGVTSSPVALTHRPSAGVDAAVAAVVTGPPALAVRNPDGVDVTVWLVDDPTGLDGLTTAVADAGRLYVADGHHRAAAIAAHEPGSGRVLCALLPADQLTVLPFHRRVTGLGDAPVDPAAVLRVLTARGLRPRPLAGPSAPSAPGVVHVTVGAAWWVLDLTDRRVLDDPVEALDVRLVEREVIVPLLSTLGARAGEVDPWTDPRVASVAAPRGLAALASPDAVGLALAAPAVEDVLRVAEAGAVMPPKSTYVLPKLRSGLLVVPR
ncbi:DUF1015 family protein [Egicoccus halophilus]|uniref:DUF1015 family protein n=1 Tax=Egicoccus halophilus TaxID=1670830 RepID=UPI0010326DA1|nr:DUF1015 family protein [Egicoccus halophilus]